MKYRGKTYTIVQGIQPHSWKWMVQIDEKTTKSGVARRGRLLGLAPFGLSIGHSRQKN
jgi:hypothetical protein